MKTFKKLACCALAITMAVGITACDESGVTSTLTSGNGMGPGTDGTTTAMATTTDPDENAATDEEIKDLNTGDFTPSGNAGIVKFIGIYDIRGDQKGKEQCDIFQSDMYGGTIEWVSAPNDYAFYEKLGTLIAADDSPDIMANDAIAFPYGVSRNMFEPMDDLIDIENPLWDGVRDIAESYRYKGNLYYFPHKNGNTYALNYDRSTIEEAGLTDPYELYVNGEWTWDAWREMMIEFCNQDDSHIGFYSTDTIISAFTATTGTPVIEVLADGTINNNINHPNITRAVEFFAELGRNNLLYPSDAPHGNWVSPQIWSGVTDKILFLGMEPEWTYIAATEEIQNKTGVENDIFNTPSDLAFVPFPRDPQADAYYAGTGSFGYMIPKGAKNIDGAVEFIYCNRLYETDPVIKDQIREDHINPEIVTYTAGKYTGMQKWKITWDAQVYDLWQDYQNSDKFVYVNEFMFGFDESVKVNICESMYSSTFGTESWTQLSEQIYPQVESVLNEYR